MNNSKYILSLDQGTTSSKAVLINEEAEIIQTSNNFSIKGIYPREGWVEYNPDDLFNSLKNAAREILANSHVLHSNIEGLGLSNQGETIIAFDKLIGRPLCNAISWQDRRSENIAKEWREKGLEEKVKRISGLTIDAYFSATKIKWILNENETAKKLLKQNRLAIATSDAWLLWQLTGGKVYVTDAATASRTMLFDLSKQDWSDELLADLEIPREILPDIVPNASFIENTVQEFSGGTLPVSGVCVDQHAALFGQRCHTKSTGKITYGTGCFALVNAGEDPNVRASGLLTALGWKINNTSHYILEGGVYSAGSIIEWLISLGILASADQADSLARSVRSNGGVYLIPAFSGLGAPHWNNTVKASWHGLETGTQKAHFVRSALESISFRVKEIIDVMSQQKINPSVINVDGGLTHSRFLMQFQADLLQTPVVVSSNPEMTALGTGLMAGIGIGFWKEDSLPGGKSDETVYEPSGSGYEAAIKGFEEWKKICKSMIII
ncbi:MAG: glycerol kinase GlpK [Cyclobacteriaceae bacterium]|nr:glycerol kinase GlpK [Cyclobacteriaceae bacterium]